MILPPASAKRPDRQSRRRRPAKSPNPAPPAARPTLIAAPTIEEYLENLWIRHRFLVSAMSASAALRREPLAPSLLAALRELLGDRLSTSAAVCAQHGRDESYHAPHAPDAVAFVNSTEEVSAIVRLCADHKTPVIAFGTGTSLEGHVAALAGGVSVDTSQMNRILRVKPKISTRPSRPASRASS